ncbi:hypothetical protein [Chryseobacterium turcicum]|uniref:Uncharacterized protein n=1 Tax=Chryseobacterium turcicum TaxID=2898076 RepID=A0A9Q3V2R0_9FLAO|nr:hypothetical protein [Chryseobacterium turcicum]MCD1115600.1 hypothetical protein [Chryseobacterium turcicum]
MTVQFTTHRGDKVALKMVNGNQIKVSLKNTNTFLNESDLTKLEQSIYKIQKNFDAVYFADLQTCRRTYSKKVIEKFSDERLFSLARFNDKNPPYFKTFTLNLRTELFKRHGLPKANYKLTFKQKSFLFANGLKRN